MPVLTPEIEAFLQEPHLGTLSTVNANRRPQASALWFQHNAGTIDFYVTANSVKARNIRRNPQVVLTVASPVWPYPQAIITGTAEEAGYDAAQAERIAVRYVGPGDGAAMHRAMNQNENRVRFRLTPYRSTWIDMSGWDFRAS